MVTLLSRKRGSVTAANFKDALLATGVSEFAVMASTKVYILHLKMNGKKLLPRIKMDMVMH